MSDNPESTTPETPAAPRWKPVSSVDRRVLGVLVEKAKTTPDTYPLSLNGLVTGANQKNNRHPVTQYEQQHIEESLERLRHLGAVSAVQGSGRVEKYRHYLYEWLGVDKLELSVMAELLLRGPQTEGELRGRAARMDPIPDLGALRTILDSLKSKGLVQALTPEGRGQIITHCLYKPEELERLRAQYAGHSSGPSSAAPETEPSYAAPPPARPSSPASPPPAAAPTHTSTVQSSGAEITALRREIDELRTTVAQLRSDLSDLSAETQRNTDELDRLRQSLGG